MMSRTSSPTYDTEATQYPARRRRLALARARIVFVVLAKACISALVLAQALTTVAVLAQAPAAQAPPELTARFTTEAVTLDGVLDEPAWQTAEVATDFYQYFPTDTARARYSTEVRVAYDDRFVYLAVRAETAGGETVVSSLQRDFSGVRNDNVAVFFDTFRDGANAFGFGITPYGVRREFLVSNGGATRQDYNVTWDVKWQGEARRTDSAYTAELAIPLTSIKFPAGADSWRFRAYRFNVESNETSTWARVPQSQLLGNLAFMGELRFERPLGASRTPLALIPYATAQAQRDFAEEAGDMGLGLGGDAKVALGDGLNLDLTANPDFSQVEVDAVFTNLTRFDIRLPEQRQFFIDNADLFGAFGDFYGTFQPFFSRRIGLAEDTLGNLIEQRILGGARLSGKVGDDWRVGALTMQTAADPANDIAGDNSGMLVAQRRVGARSRASAFVVNRETFGRGGLDADVPRGERANRVIGAEYFLASADGAWNGKAFAHKSVTNGDGGDGYSAQVSGVYTRGSRWLASVDATYVGEEFRSDLGFVPRKDFLRTAARVRHFFYPRRRERLSRWSLEGLLLNVHRPGLGYRYTDFSRRVTGALDFADLSTLELNVQHNFIYLAGAFDPSRTGAEPLPGDADYRFWDASAEYASNQAGLLTYGLTAGAGEFFNGRRYSLAGALGYRFQPYVNLAATFGYDGIRLPAPYARADLYLASLRTEVTFTRSLFWTTVVQYATQRRSLGVNSRLQWRYAPLSDLYFVYNDGYSTSGTWAPRFRSVNLKVVYWLNV